MALLNLDFISVAAIWSQAPWRVISQDGLFEGYFFLAPRLGNV